jgi:hypothetical protein
MERLGIDPFVQKCVLELILDLSSNFPPPALELPLPEDEDCPTLYWRSPNRLMTLYVVIRLDDAIVNSNWKLEAADNAKKPFRGSFCKIFEKHGQGYRKEGELFADVVKERLKLLQEQV